MNKILKFISVAFLIFACLPAWAENSVQINWVIVPIPEKGEPTSESYEPPMTQITLILKGPINEKVELGKIHGNCGEISVSLNAGFFEQRIKPGEKPFSGMGCWWAGSGNEYILLKRGNSIFLKGRWLDEGADIPSFKIIKKWDIGKKLK